MKYQVVISERAEDELTSIVNYILRNFSDSFAARNTYDAISKKIHQLALFPKSAPVVKTIGTIDFRIAHVKNFAVIYHVDDDARLVKVRSILYARRNLLELL